MLFEKKKKNSEKLGRTNVLVVKNWKKSFALAGIFTVLPVALLLVLVYFGLGEEDAKAQPQPSWTEANCPKSKEEMASKAVGTQPGNWTLFEGTHSNVPVWSFKSIDPQGVVNIMTVTKFTIPFGFFAYPYHSGPPALADELSSTHNISASQGTWYCVKTT